MLTSRDPTRHRKNIAGTPLRKPASSVSFSAAIVFTLARKTSASRPSWTPRAACQNEVSIRLAGQVLRALNELVRGFQEADRAARGKILGDALQHDPNHIYGGMLTTLMRMVPPDPGRAHFSTLNPGRFLPETGRRAFFTQALLKDTKSGKRASRADRGSRPTSATSADGS